MEKTINDEMIDIVIPWVDGSDPEWLEEKNQYIPSVVSDSSEARYRAWDTFRYWFRGIEENAPWVRKIHFLTYGHVPEWLDLKNPKIHIVNHKEFIPEKYLPTFSSHTIELNMHRIPGLSEKFIYFNDDVFLVKKVLPNDFFLNGRPKDASVMGIVKNSDTSNYMPYIMLNILAIINMNFDKKEVISKNRDKWFSAKYGKYNIFNIILSKWSDCFTGFRNFHTCIAYNKSTLIEVWKHFPDELDRTCMHKFRSKEDVNQYLFRYWQLVTGEFEPQKPMSAYMTIGSDAISDIEEYLRNAKIKVICINDDPTSLDFEKEQTQVNEILEKQFPKKSSFEK